MKKRIIYIIPTLLVLAFVGVLIYTSYSLLKNATIGKIMVLIGILLIFGTVTVLVIGNALTTFWGTRVIGEVMYTKCFPNANVEYNEWFLYYAFRDNQGKLRFGSHRIIGRNVSNKQLYVRYLGVFQSAKVDKEVKQEELELYKPCDIDLKEAENIYKTKHVKKYWIIIALTAIISISLIIVGAIIG